MTDEIKIPYPTAGILARLSEHLRSKLKLNTPNMSIEKMVFHAMKLPSFAIKELWRDFHRGTNLDKPSQKWLVERIQRHSFSHLEAQAKLLYDNVKRWIDEHTT